MNERLDPLRGLAAVLGPDLDVVLGGGGYNPWTVARYWAGMWGRLAGQPFPEELPADARELLASMECDLIDEDETLSTFEKPETQQLLARQASALEGAEGAEDAEGS